MGDLRKKAFAWILSKVSDRYETLVRRRKADLLGSLEGTVVEIGPGTGPNLPYLDPGAFWVGVEPNRHMSGYLQEAAKAVGRSLRLVRGSAGALPFADDSVDVVLSTLVLCSVGDDLAPSLHEIRRVLRPGGRFVFLEHVAAPRRTLLRRIQRWVRPVWRRVADGCRTDQETDRWIREAGFSRVEMEHFRLSLPLVAPHVSGVAYK